MNTQGLKLYPGNANAIPYANLDQLALWTKDDIAAFGEASFDEVVQLNVIREMIYQESALLATTNNVVVSRAQTSLDVEIFNPGDSAVQTTYPVPAEAIGVTGRQEPVTFNIKKDTLAMAETRYFISLDAKLRGASNWLELASARRAAEHLAENKDRNIMASLKTMAPAVNNVAAANTWSSAAGDAETDIAKAIENIMKNSRTPSSQVNKANAFTVITPVAAWSGVRKLKLIRNIIQPVNEFITTEYKAQLVFTRAPTVLPAGVTWPLLTEALVIPTMDLAIGYLGTFDGGGIVPAQVREQHARGEDIITREWFKFISTPEPLDGVTTTNARIAKITAVA